MSFGGLFDGGGGGGMQFPFASGFASSPALSLALVCVRRLSRTGVAIAVRRHESFLLDREVID